MGLLIECPECRRRNSLRVKVKEKGKPTQIKPRKLCECGFALSRFSGRIWWIEYYDHDKRLRRERIGPSKEAAEHRLREVLSARAEGRHIKKSPDVCTHFKTLAAWYMDLPEVKAKRSYYRDKICLQNLLPFFGDCLLKDIKPGMVEAYKQKRLKEPTKKRPQLLTKPASVNREISCLKTIINKAIKNGKAEQNPAEGVKLLKENNVRDRVLTSEEFIRLLVHSPDYLKPIIKIAYYTGMRKSEILNLTWEQVDLKEGFIKLNHEDTKTQENRWVPLNRELLDMLKAMPRGLPGVEVFSFRGKSIGSIWRGLKAACQKAKIENFTFHDFRHTAINNWRVQGHDYFRIMAATGHKTMSVFKRYNTVSKEELKSLVAEM